MVGLAVQWPVGLLGAKALAVINGHVYTAPIELTKYFIFWMVTQIQQVMVFPFAGTAKNSKRKRKEFL
jgi:hypothetical protein